MGGRMHISERTLHFPLPVAAYGIWDYGTCHGESQSLLRNVVLGVPTLWAERAVFRIGRTEFDHNVMLERAALAPLSIVLDQGCVPSPEALSLVKKTLQRAGIISVENCKSEMHEPMWAIGEAALRDSGRYFLAL